MGGLARRIAGLLPAPLYDALKSLRKARRRRAWERRVAGDDTARLDGPRLVEQLRALGLPAGRDLLVHGALSSLGFVEGGAETVIAALREAIGPEATLLMPAYPMRGSMLKTMQDPTPFRVAEDPSTMGKITEVFRAMPGALRSAHPTHSVAAQGPAAAAYTAEHHRSGSPCGPGSPFRMLSERKGLILCLGSGVGKVTSHHVIEDLLGDFPVAVYLPEAFAKTVVFPDGREERVSVRVHDPRLQPLRVDNCPAKEAQMREAMAARGILREGPVGQATAHLIDAAGLDAMHRALVAEGVTIYEGLPARVGVRATEATRP